MIFIKRHIYLVQNSIFNDNSSYRSYQRFKHINEAKGSFSIVLTLKPRLHVAVNKGGFARGRNCDNSYYYMAKNGLRGWL